MNPYKIDRIRRLEYSYGVEIVQDRFGYIAYDRYGDELTESEDFEEIEAWLDENGGV